MTRLKIRRGRKVQSLTVNKIGRIVRIEDSLDPEMAAVLVRWEDGSEQLVYVAELMVFV